MTAHREGDRSMNYPKHGLAADEAAAPERADWTCDQHWERYTAAEHAVWKTLYERQMRLLAGRACDEFLAGLQHLPMSAATIPDFAPLNRTLKQRTGWQVVAVPGLVPDEVFFDHLAHRRFPAGRFIRRPEQLDYLEEPDVFHDVFGHVPLLMHPIIADFIQAYGEGGLRAQRLGYLPQLARLYWYTIEFGLVQQPNGLRLFGAGIASSFTESQFCLDSDSPHRVAFELERVLRTRYRIDDFQETYFVLRDLPQLLELTAIDFAPLYAHIATLSELAPGELLAKDQLLQRGHQRKARPGAEPIRAEN